MFDLFFRHEHLCSSEPQKDDAGSSFLERERDKRTPNDDDRVATADDDDDAKEFRPSFFNKPPQREETMGIWVQSQKKSSKSRKNILSHVQTICLLKCELLFILSQETLVLFSHFLCISVHWFFNVCRFFCFFCSNQRQFCLVMLNLEIIYRWTPLNDLCMMLIFLKKSLFVNVLNLSLFDKRGLKEFGLLVVIFRYFFWGMTQPPHRESHKEIREKLSIERMGLVRHFWAVRVATYLTWFTRRYSSSNLHFSPKKFHAEAAGPKILFVPIELPPCFRKMFPPLQGDEFVSLEEKS